MCIRDRIRAVSVGEIVEIKVTCKDDNTTKVQYNLNLSEVNVIKPEGHSNKIMLSDDMGVIMKYPQWNDFITG